MNFDLCNVNISCKFWWKSHQIDLSDIVLSHQISIIEIYLYIFWLLGLKMMIK